MFLFIVGLLSFLAAVIALVVGIKIKSIISIGSAAALVVLGAILIFVTTFWSNGVGEAKVMVNGVDRTVVGTIEEPGSGFKPAWVDFVDFDLFSQEVKFAGGDTAPSYAGGKVDGKEITVNVGENGETRANIDLFANYSLDASKVVDIYQDFRSQERFAEQIITKQVLSVARQIPAGFTASEFRGAGRGPAETAILQALNDKLEPYGIEFTTLTIQDIRYPQVVEDAITAIEQANQDAQKAEANQRTAVAEAERKRIEAEGNAQAKVEEARGQAESNRLIAESITPEVVELRRIEALQKAAESGKLIIDGGDGNLLLQPVE